VGRLAANKLRWHGKHQSDGQDFANQIPQNWYPLKITESLMIFEQIAHTRPGVCLLNFALRLPAALRC
jgi:hypothetical protein